MKRHRFKLAGSIAIALLVSSSLIQAKENQIPESLAKPKQANIAQKTKAKTSNLAYEYEFALQRKLNLQQLKSFSLQPPENNKQARIQFLNEALSNTKREKRWHIAWNSIYTLGVINAISTSLDPEDREDKIFANTKIGTGLLALLSQNVTDYYPKLMTDITPLANDASSEQISQAEKLLKDRRDFVIDERSFKSRLPSYGIALASSWIIKDAGYYDAAAINLGTALIGIELTRRTLPQTALKSWESYESNFSYNLSKQSDEHKFAWNVQPYLGGLSFNAAF